MESIFLKRLRIIHFALCAGCTFLGAIFYFTSAVTPQVDTSFKNPLSIVGVSLGILVIVSTLLYNKKVKDIDMQASMDVKRVKYQSAFILMLAIIEGAAIFNIIVFSITQNLFHLFIAGAFVVNMISKFPNKYHIAQVLNCTIEEI